jgi:hypothetical protein
VLFRYPVLVGHPVLPRHRMLAGLKVLAVVRLPDANALANPDRTGAKHAPQLSRTRQVDAFTGAQREVLVIAGGVTGSMTSVPPPRWITSVAGARPARLTAARRREPVVGIRPDGSLLRILPGRADALGEFRQVVSTSLADSRERHRVPGQVQRDLV